MANRLLIDLEALNILDALSKSVRRFLDHLTKLRLTPEACADDYEYDSLGRQIAVSILADNRMYYWIADGDQHTKILALQPADKPQR